jgi:hypothetical protein
LDGNAADFSGRIRFRRLVNGFDDYDGPMNVEVTQLWNAVLKSYTNLILWNGPVTFGGVPNTSQIGGLDGISGTTVDIVPGTYRLRFNNGFCEQEAVITICDNCGAIAGNEYDDINGRVCETCEETTLVPVHNECC